MTRAVGRRITILSISSATPEFEIFVVPLLLLMPLFSERTSSHQEEVEGHLISNIDVILTVDSGDPLFPPSTIVLTRS